MSKKNIYFVSEYSINKYKRDEAWENEIQSLIDLIEEEQTFSDFFRKPEHCNCFGLLLGFGVRGYSESNDYAHNVYVDNNGLKPVVHIFPRFNDFLYLYENIGRHRTIKGKGAPETNRNLLFKAQNRNNKTTKVSGGKRKTRTIRKLLKTRRQRTKHRK